MALLAGCAGNPPRSAHFASSPDSAPDHATTHEDIYYHLIVAELARMRNQREIAIEHYLQASKLSSDPEIAEHATRLAFYAKDYDSAYKAAQRWIELAPENDKALQSVAVVALVEGRSEAALKYLNRILQREEAGSQHGFQVVANLLGRARGEHDEQAMQIMGQIVAERPGNAHAHLAYGELALLFGRFDDADRAFKRALAIEPDLPDALISHARLLYERGNVDEALANLRMAVDDLEDNERVRLAYGRLLLETKRYQQAREQFTLLSQAAPEDSDYLYTLALLELDIEDTAAAETHLRRLLELGERVDEAHYYLGRIAESKQALDQAMKEYERVGRSEYQFDAQMRIGRLLAQSGQLEAGLGYLRSLRMQNPESSIAVRLYLTESSILGDDRRYQEAIDVLSEALQSVPGNTDLLYSRALLYEKVDRVDLLEQDLRAVLLREPENADALNALGYTLADRTARYEEAYDLITQAIKLKPDEAAIIDSMGWVLYRLGRVDEAVTYLKRALSLQYDNEIAGHLSEVLWVVGQHKAAKTLLESALEKSPDDKTLLQVKEQLDASQIDSINVP